MAASVCLVTVELHFGEVGDLKGKRKLIHSLKARLRQRCGAAVAEIDGQDKWQRATLLCALVGDGEVGARADELERLVEARHPGACRFERRTLTLKDLNAID